MRFIDEDQVICVIERFIGYIDEDMIERIKIAIKKVPTAAGELTSKNDPLIQRLRHLLESDYIRSFDEVDPFTHEYKRDIREADKIIGYKVKDLITETDKILGYKVEDLIILAQELRNKGLEADDLTDSNKAFINGARYAVERLNKEMERSITSHIEELFIGDDKSDKQLKEAKESAKRWNDRR